MKSMDERVSRRWGNACGWTTTVTRIASDLRVLSSHLFARPILNRFQVLVSSGGLIGRWVNIHVYEFHLHMIDRYISITDVANDHVRSVLQRHMPRDVPVSMTGCLFVGIRLSFVFERRDIVYVSKDGEMHEVKKKNFKLSHLRYSHPMFEMPMHAAVYIPLLKQTVLVDPFIRLLAW